eukprot:1181188-Prorocentrum_minimum.AAC.3
MCQIYKQGNKHLTWLEPPAEQLSVSTTPSVGLQVRYGIQNALRIEALFEVTLLYATVRLYALLAPPHKVGVTKASSQLLQLKIAASLAIAASDGCSATPGCGATPFCSFPSYGSACVSTVFGLDNTLTTMYINMF